MRVRDYGDEIKDQNAFVFNLESNGQHENPMKFDIKEEKCWRAFCLFSDDVPALFCCGWDDIKIMKENNKSNNIRQ